MKNINKQINKQIYIKYIFAIIKFRTRTNKIYEIEFSIMNINYYLINFPIKLRGIQ